MANAEHRDILALLEGCPNEVYHIASKPILFNGMYIQINRAGIVCATPEDFHITRNASYRYSVIHCAFRGRGFLSLRGRQYKIQRGQCFLLTAQEAHEYWADPSDPWGLVWVEFGGGGSAQLTRYILNLGGPVFEGKVFDRLTEQCTAILSRPEFFEPRVSSTIYDMLMSLCAQAESSIDESSIKKDILDYIDANLPHLTLEKIAANFGYNPVYFSALFSRTVGTSFSRYVQLQRMNRACILLATTEWSMENIAQELGFYDASHFIHSFKSIEGITPAAYRKENSFTHTSISRF